MKILIPDAQFQKATVEEHVFGAAAQIVVRHAEQPAQISSEDWANCDAILLWHIMTIAADSIAKLKRCRIIVRCGIGYDRIDTQTCAEHTIAVCNVPSYDMTDVASSTVIMALSLMRGLPSYHDALKADLRKGWQWDGPPALRRIRYQKFAVIGCGRIGTAVLLRAQAFGMEVAYYDPYLPTGHENSLNFKRFNTLSEMLNWADVVSLHTPLNSETQNLIDQAAIQAMKPGMIVVNCARGGLLDLDALEQGIRQGIVAAAALDAFTQEPPSAHPLLDAWAKDEDWVRGRLCITPHSSWYSQQTMADIRHDAAVTARDLLCDGLLRNCVNQDLLLTK